MLVYGALIMSGLLTSDTRSCRVTVYELIMQKI